jgi:hypothetical protein
MNPAQIPIKPVVISSFAMSDEDSSDSFAVKGVIKPKGKRGRPKGKRSSLLTQEKIVVTEEIVQESLELFVPEQSSSNIPIMMICQFLKPLIPI